MRRMIEIKSRLIAKTGYFFLTIVLVLITAMIFSPQSIAGEFVTYEGTLQGASCVHYKKDCPDDDIHIAIEHDFVLLLPNGDHYFLPNLNRAVKARYVAKPVRIRGEADGGEIWVDRLDVKKGTTYINRWSWKKQQELYKGGGG